MREREKRRSKEERVTMKRRGTGRKRRGEDEGMRWEKEKGGIEEGKRIERERGEKKKGG
jgi:hypothetical protein